MRSIKTKLFSLAMAVSMVLALAGCAMSAPSTVGSIGGVEIPAGIYLLAQYNYYVVGECQVKVEHCLMALPGVALDTAAADALTANELTLQDSERHTKAERTAFVDGALAALAAG